MTTPFVLPALGDSVNEVVVVHWLKKLGDAVKRGDALLEVETDKITTEVCAEVDGTLVEIKAHEGSKARAGDVLAEIGDADVAQVETSESASEPAAESVAVSRPYAGRVSPVVSRMVAEHHLDLAEIPGTGEGGRVTKQDVLDFLARSKQDWGDKGDKATAFLSGSTEAYDLTPLTPMRRRIAAHMVMSKQAAPHATTVWEFDFSAVAAHRARHKDDFARDGVRLTWLAYVLSATAHALKQHPGVNSQWHANGIALMREINIGVATALEEGLIVPVIHHADELNLKGIARKIGELAQKARNKQLAPSETQGSTFTITNHGTSGSLLATPIINQPQAGILGFGAIEKRVKVISDGGSDAIAVRPCAYMSFAFDHRILDGALADAFMSAIKVEIETRYRDRDTEINTPSSG